MGDLGAKGALVAAEGMGPELWNCGLKNYGRSNTVDPFKNVTAKKCDPRGVSLKCYM